MLGCAVRLEKGTAAFDAQAGDGLVLVDHRVGESVEQDMYDIAICKKESIAVYLGGLARAASALNSNVDARAVAQKALAQIIRVEGQANRISVLERRPFADLKKLFSDAQAKILCGFTPGEAQDAIVGYSRKIPVSSMTLHGDFIEGENMCTALGAVRDEDLMLLAVTYVVGSETRVIGTIVMPTDTAKRVLSAPVGVEFISKINVDILGQVVEVAKVLHSSSAIVAAEGDVYTYEMMALLHAIDPAKWPVVAGDEIDAMRAVKKRLVQLEAELGKCAEDNQVEFVSVPLGEQVLADAATVGEALRAMLRPGVGPPPPQGDEPNQASESRCHHLYRFIKSASEWQEFLELFIKVVLDIPPDDHKYRVYIAATGRRLLYPVMEKALRDKGTVASEYETLVFSGVGSADASELMSSVQELLYSAEIDLDVDTGKKDAMQVEVTAVTPIDTSGTEYEVDERAHLLDTARSLEKGDKESMAAIAALVASNKAQGAMAKAREASSAVQRLLFSGVELDKAIANHVPQSLYTQLRDVRSCFARRVDAQFVQDSCEPSALVQGANRLVRIGRMRKVRLLHYLDLEDSGTPESPLVSFAEFEDEIAKGRFSSAIRKMQRAWTYCQPEDTANIMDFCDALVDEVHKFRDSGVSWVDIGHWYKSVFAKVDHTAEEYARRAQSERLRGKPLASWVTDSTTKYAKKMDLSKQEAIAEKVAGSKLEELGADLRAAIDALKGKLGDNEKKLAEAQRAAKEAAKQAGHNKNLGLSKKDKKALEAERKRAAERGAEERPPKQNKGEQQQGTWDGKSRQKQMEHLTATLGTHKGKKPCVFFHTPGRECKNGASCAFYHEKDE